MIESEPLGARPWPNRAPGAGGTRTAVPIFQLMGKKKRNKKKHSKRTFIERAEIEAIRAAVPWLEHPAARAAGLIGNVGDQPPLLALSGGVAAMGALRRDRRMLRAGVRMIAAHWLATAMKTQGKDHVDRSRPDALIEEDEYRMEKGGSDDPGLRSFPSGHTAGAVAVALAAAREYPRHRWALYGAAGLVGALQVPRQAHFPTDVIAGALLGLLAERLVDMAAGVFGEGSAD